MIVSFDSIKDKKYIYINIKNLLPVCELTCNRKEILIFNNLFRIGLLQFLFQIMPCIRFRAQGHLFRRSGTNQITAGVTSFRS